MAHVGHEIPPDPVRVTLGREVTEHQHGPDDLAHGILHGSRVDAQITMNGPAQCHIQSCRLTGSQGAPREFGKLGVEGSLDHRFALKPVRLNAQYRLRRAVGQPDPTFRVENDDPVVDLPE